jgi:hypothetical protein
VAAPVASVGVPGPTATRDPLGESPGINLLCGAFLLFVMWSLSSAGRSRKVAPGAFWLLRGLGTSPQSVLGGLCMQRPPKAGLSPKGSSLGQPGLRPASPGASPQRGRHPTQWRGCAKAGMCQGPPPPALAPPGPKQAFDQRSVEQAWIAHRTLDPWDISETSHSGTMSPRG